MLFLSRVPEEDHGIPGACATPKIGNKKFWEIVESVFEYFTGIEILFSYYSLLNFQNLEYWSFYC